MASDNSSETPAEGDGDAATLALEVKALRALLEELQVELKPAVQSSLRERSSELQRAGADLAEQQAAIDRLTAALAAAEARSARLEEEAARWREAAHRGLDEIAERAREAAARFAQETAELNQALTAAKARLDAAQAEALKLKQARDAAREEAVVREDRIRVLETKVLGREQRLQEMTRSLSWRITTPLRWITRPLAASLQPLLLELARRRRRMMKR